MSAPRKRRTPPSSSDPDSRDVVVGEVDTPEAESAPVEVEDNLDMPPAKTPQESAAATRFVDIPVPSRGVLYDGALPDGIVRVRKMLVAEEQIMFGSGGSILSKINRLLNACCMVPRGFKMRDMLVADRFFVLLALRTETYGTKYKITFRCDSCGSPNKKIIDIAQELDESPAADDLVEPWEVDLPDSGITLGLRFRRGHDEEESVRAAKIARQKGVEGTTEDQSTVMSLARRILTIDGSEVANMLESRKIVTQMTARDSAAIRITEDKLEPGVDATIYPECTACGGVNEQQMPFDHEFFRPSVL